MPTKIADIYDAIVTVCEQSLSGYFRLANPYELDENAFLRLESGYGVAIGPGLDANLFTGCLGSWERVYTISVVKRLTTTDHNIAAKSLIEKSLLDDHRMLSRAFYNNNLGGRVHKCYITDDTGLTFVDGDRLKFVALQMSLLTEYTEEISLNNNI